MMMSLLTTFLWIKSYFQGKIVMKYKKKKAGKRLKKKMHLF